MHELVEVEAALALRHVLNKNQAGAYNILTTLDSTYLHQLADAVDDLATMIDEIQIERGR